MVLGPRGSDLAITQAYPVGNTLSTMLRGPSLGDESPGGAVRRSSLITSGGFLPAEDVLSKGEMSKAKAAAGIFSIVNLLKL